MFKAAQKMEQENAYVCKMNYITLFPLISVSLAFIVLITWCRYVYFSQQFVESLVTHLISCQSCAWTQLLRQKQEEAAIVLYIQSSSL